jgi:hypothetical protein
MFTEYDGNAPGIAWGVPHQNSYASMMELGFNGDVRELSSNLQLIQGPSPVPPGYLYDANGYQITVYFRYSPSQGFRIAFAPSVNPAIPVYTIRLLPCAYIANAHFVHGFGFYDASVSTTEFVPRNIWTCAYTSDDTPNLLPFRYVTIRSEELTKDRRLLSFQNANSNRFNNEMAIIALSRVYTGTYHTENVGDDATVISKRDDYQPQVARLIITDEEGIALLADSPISNLFQTPDIVNDTVKNSFITGPLQGRGNVIFMNDLLFGTRNVMILPYSTMSTPVPVSINQSLAATPNGISGYQNTGVNVAPYVGFQTVMSTNFFSWYKGNLNSQNTEIISTCIPLIVTPNGMDTFPTTPDSYTYAGVSSQVVSQVPCNMFGHLPTSGLLTSQVSVFTWDPIKNPKPAMAVDATLGLYAFDPGADTTRFPSVNVWIIAYSLTINQIVAASVLIGPIAFSPVSTPITLSSADAIPFVRSPYVPKLLDVQKVAFYFCFQSSVRNNPIPPNTHGYCHQNMTVVAPGKACFFNPNEVGVQTEYINPANNVDDDRPYEFGNPQANAKAEELIHEIVLVADKN